LVSKSCRAAGSSNALSPDSIATAAFPKNFEASIASAQAWVYVASVQLIVRWGHGPATDRGCGSGRPSE
jgi:hypothetical protein